MACPQDGAAARLRLRLPAHHFAVRLARARVRCCAVGVGLEEGELDRLEFVVGELLSNAVDHGGGQRALGAEDWDGRMHMWLEFDCRAVGWSLRVEDEGGGDPERLRPLLMSPGGLPDLDDERGRGFFLIQSMLDSLKVDSARNGKGIALIAEVILPARLA
ncbi:MAG: ATP-binding protein [Planctomycetota bacterium]